MSELSWNDVREGDKVKVKHERGATIEGIYEGQEYGNLCLISGLNCHIGRLELLEHTPTFKNGDIGVVTSDSTGSNFVGIYLDGTFYSSDSNYRTKIHTLDAHEGYTIKVVGNIYGT